jgi:cell division protein FtsW
LIPLGIAFALILLSSVSAALFIAILSFGILFIGGVKWSHIYKTAGIGGGLLLIVVILQLTANIILIPRLSTAIGRIEEFFQGDMTEQMKGMDVHEKQRLADETFQADMARVAVSSVGILGKGPGNSTQRYVLPHPYSDYVYAIIIEEYGLLGGATVLMLYIWFLYRCVILVKNCSKLFSALTVVGIGLLISIQAVLHILVNVDIIPVTGHTLPLISYGGTSFLILCSAFGVILSVSRTIEITSKKIKKEENDTVENKVEEYEIIGPNNEFK